MHINCMTDECCKGAPPVIGLLLIYYEQYAAKSIQRFISILNAVGKDNVLIIIQNNRFELPPINHPSYHVIAGDNSLREFSGWQAGIKFCGEQGLMLQDGILIVANDTFCNHNKFGPFTRLLFVREFRRLLRRPSRLAIAGEVHSNGYEYTIVNKRFSSWVSTYLFAMTIALSNKMDGVVPHDISLDTFFSNKADMEKFLTGPLSENLKQHIQHWIFGLNARTKWYGSSPISDENKHQFIGKAKSILCEKNLSATANSLDAEIISVFSSTVLVQVRRLERLIPQ